MRDLLQAMGDPLWTMRDPIWTLMQLEARTDERLYPRKRFCEAGVAAPIDLAGRQHHARRVLELLERHRMRCSNPGTSRVTQLQHLTGPVELAEAMRDVSWMVDEPATCGAMLAHAPGMPAQLAELVSPPCLGLWLAGDEGLLDSSSVRVGIVGSRTARAESLAIARSIAANVVRAGGIVVSGLAAGIDGEAHRGALDAGGATIGVLASGLERIYPRRHAGMVRRMLDGAAARRGARGLLVSEYGPGSAEPRPYRFRERNRIIAALSDYVVVVQAHRRSGSMITARDAIELGVPIGVVSSSVTDPAFSGSIELLRDGADCIVDAPSVLGILERHDLASVPTGSRIPDHSLATILTVPRPLEDLAALAGLDVSDARRLLIDLELDGLVERSSQGLWINGCNAVSSQ